MAQRDVKRQVESVRFAVPPARAGAELGRPGVTDGTSAAARGPAPGASAPRAAGAHVVEQLLHHVGAHRVVRGEEAAAEMQAERLPLVEIEHDGAGIAAERRAIVPDAGLLDHASRRPARVASYCRSCRRSAP